MERKLKRDDFFVPIPGNVKEYSSLGHNAEI
jgi:hypothetical protein